MVEADSDTSSFAAESKTSDVTDRAFGASTDRRYSLSIRDTCKWATLATGTVVSFPRLFLRLHFDITSILDPFRPLLTFSYHIFDITILVIMTKKLFSKFALPSTFDKEKQSGMGFGCMGITAFYGASMPDDQALDLLQQVYDAGCRHFDTAEAYATPEKHNETLLGQFFKTVPRDSYSVATKYWPKEPTYDYDTVKAALTNSLKRLGLDYVDLYYAHRVLSLDGAKEFGHTARKLKEEGLIKEVGVSEISPKWLRVVHTLICPIDAVQQEWSLITRHPIEEDLIPVCKELDITVVAYSPLARNLLATKVEATPDDWRAGLPRYAQENLEKNQNIADTVHAMAEKYHCTPAQLSLAWLFQKASQLGVSVVPIPGSTKLEHALGNLKGTQVIISDPMDLNTLEGLAAQVSGARANEQYMNLSIEGNLVKD